MNRGELTAVIAVVLIGAVLLGWILRWIFGRIGGPGAGGLAASADLAQRLEAAEEARRRAEQRLSKVEADFKARLSDLEVELASALESLAKAEHQADDVRAAYRVAMEERDPPA
ncbi:hypothetical protein [uncultured Amaricoccus sp.]|uniref:hypothetical protein n=1 Tax=uncultured Amaricoccus sp. TaxID=339341 RepID=UPI0026198950|nr:hypothetical protein [uncultured Amaricoccus sp.]